MDKTEKIGIFGGSFNPPHNGHINLALSAYDALTLDKLLIIPSCSPVHKSGNEYADSYSRLEMCRLAFAGLRKGIEVSPVEIDRGGQSYTYDTLCKIKADNPNSELFLIVGSDMLSIFDKWYKYSEILSMCRLCVLDRGESCDISQTGIPENLKNYDIKIINVYPVRISSSEIRKLIKTGEKIQGLLPEKAEEFIIDNGLYK